ncbi:bacteriophage protein [Planctomycetia bacterium]|nr:bacteriophage protein [Planctomycetia bacterium]
MAAGTWTLTNEGRTKLLDGTFDIDSDTWKCALFLSTSNLAAGSTTYAALTNEHANANGYLTGGKSVTLALSGTTTVTVSLTDNTWTASGGSIVARFAVIYEVAGRVLAYALLDSTPADVTVTTGNALNVLGTNGVFTLA